MELERFKQEWESEEAAAQIHGWDFSHIHERYAEEADLPWDYKEIVRSYLNDSDALLDIDTGGGEFLLSLCHPYARTSATEEYPPNVELCARTLLPLGIDFRGPAGCEALPFADASFDVVINRHGSYCVQELYRVLRPGGIFITQQVGEENDRELVELLLPGTGKPFPGHNLSEQCKKFSEGGFRIVRAEEAFRPIRFFDIGALVWFARIIEWEFPGFSVAGCLKRLALAQKIVEEKGSVDGTIHRFLIAAVK